MPAVLVLVCSLLLGLHMGQWWQRLLPQAPTDFKCLYYAAKYMAAGHNPYDYERLRSYVRSDAEAKLLPLLEVAYSHLEPLPPVVYPPFSLRLLVPFTWLPFGQAALLHRLLLVGSVMGIFWLAAWCLLRGARVGWPNWLALLGLFAYLISNQAIENNLYLGQQNLLVAFLVLVAIGASGRLPWLGLVLLLLALGVKPSVGLVLLPFAYWQRGSVRFWLQLGIGLLVLGVAGLGHWQDYIFQPETGSSAAWLGIMQSSAYNQALGGVLYQIVPKMPYYMVALLGIGLLYCLLALWAGKQTAIYTAGGISAGRVALALLPAVLLCYLLGPVSWYEHAVVALPVLAIALPEVWRRVLANSVASSLASQVQWLVLLLLIYWAFAFSAIELHAPFGTLVVLQAQPYHFLFLGLITLLASFKKGQ